LLSIPFLQPGIPIASGNTEDEKSIDLLVTEFIHHWFLDWALTTFTNSIAYLPYYKSKAWSIRDC